MDFNFVLKDVNGNDVEISKEEVTDLMLDLWLESPNYLEGFNDFIDWILSDLKYKIEKDKDILNGKIKLIN